MVYEVTASAFALVPPAIMIPDPPAEHVGMLRKVVAGARDNTITHLIHQAER